MDYSAQIPAQRSPAPKRARELPIELQIALTILLVIAIAVFTWLAAANCGATQVSVF